MADAYWRYTGDRQQSATLASQLAKRPRSDHEIPSGLGISSYFPHVDERGGQHVVRDTDSINASYDRYLRSAQISHGGESGRSVSVGLGGLQHLDDPRTSPMGVSDPVVVANDLSMGLGGRSKIPLPPDASGTLFVEGLPANCTRREVAHIFRPFVGYKEVRLVNKGSRHSGGDPLVLCFVDFQSPAHAATAMDALKGVSHSLECTPNPGPFSIKEHVMITVFANTGAGSVYATHVSSAVKLYYKKSLGFIPGS